jgi:hypothetical protein
MYLLSGRKNVDLDSGGEVTRPGPHFAALYITKMPADAWPPEFAAAGLKKGALTSIRSAKTNEL